MIGSWVITWAASLTPLFDSIELLIESSLKSAKSSSASSALLTSSMCFVYVCSSTGSIFLGSYRISCRAYVCSIFLGSYRISFEMIGSWVITWAASLTPLFDSIELLIESSLKSAKSSSASSALLTSSMCFVYVCSSTGSIFLGSYRISCRAYVCSIFLGSYRISCRAYVCSIFLGSYRISCRAYVCSIFLGSYRISFEMIGSWVITWAASLTPLFDSIELLIESSLKSAKSSSASSALLTSSMCFVYVCSSTGSIFLGSYRISCRAYVCSIFLGSYRISCRAYVCSIFLGSYRISCRAYVWTSWVGS
jgi:hypothetical protein